MKRGAVLESLRAPTFTVVSPQQSVKDRLMEKMERNPISINFVFIFHLPFEDSNLFYSKMILQGKTF
jgi:hypothetical protein